MGGYPNLAEESCLERDSYGFESRPTYRSKKTCEKCGSQSKRNQKVSKMMDRVCIVCDKDVGAGPECLRPREGDDVSTHGVADSATIWRSHGNYGSTEYDSMHGGHWLEVYICDECLAKKGTKVRAVESDRAKWIATFDDTFDALKARHKVLAEERRLREDRHLRMAKKVVFEKLVELGDEPHDEITALHAIASDSLSPEGLRFRRMLNLLTSNGIRLEDLKKEDYSGL